MKLTIDSNQPIAQTAKDLGVNPNTLKTELVHHQRYQTRVEAKQQDIVEYIAVFYNRERLYSANDYLSPAEYEMQLKSA